LRLDNVVRRGGLTLPRPQARQGIGHGHFLVNWRKCTVASRLLKPGEMVHVKARRSLQQLYGGITRDVDDPWPGFLSVDSSRLTVGVLRDPLPE
ncbi:30S ribosomal protein S4, partial [Citrobacter sp. AAK_AS5]